MKVKKAIYPSCYCKLQENKILRKVVCFDGSRGYCSSRNLLWGNRDDTTIPTLLIKRISCFLLVKKLHYFMSKEHKWIVCNLLKWIKGCILLIWSKNPTNVFGVKTFVCVKNIHLVYLYTIFVKHQWKLYFNLCIVCTVLPRHWGKLYYNTKTFPHWSCNRYIYFQNKNTTESNKFKKFL